MMLVGAKASFCAAHSLPQHKGLHGHSYEVWAYHDAPADAELMQRLLAKVCAELDHGILNEKISEPTMENVALYVRDQLTVLHPHEERVLSRPRKIVVLRPVEGLCAEAEWH